MASPISGILPQTITDLVAAELRAPTFGVLEQYLPLMTPKWHADRPQIAHIAFQPDDSTATAYVEVEDASFYLAFDFELGESVTLEWVDTAPFVAISYRPLSEELSVEQLLNLTTLTPTDMERKGALMPGKRRQPKEYSYNALEFGAPAAPNALHTKLTHFLDYLLTDLAGIHALRAATGCDSIFIAVCHHIGNTNFTGLFLEKAIIDRLAKLGLGVTFDLYAEGRPLE